MRHFFLFLLALMGFVLIVDPALAAIAVTGAGSRPPRPCFPDRGPRHSPRNHHSPAGSRSPSLIHTPIAVADRGRPVEVAVSLSDPPAVFTITLNYRRKGETLYFSQPFTAAGASTCVATIPGYMVNAREGLEYYIEMSDEIDRRVASSGTKDAPHAMAVRSERKSSAYLPWILLTLAAAAILALLGGRDRRETFSSSLPASLHTSSS